jgi:hypothetical protein
MKVDLKNSTFLKDWKKQNIFNFKQLHPNLKENQIEDFLDKVIEENINIKTGILNNNYNGRKIAVDTLRIYDWYKRVKPITAGNGCFFMNQEQAINPAAHMQDTFLILRKKYKNTMYEYNENDYNYSLWDRMQGNEKVNVNSYYGSSGAKTSRFYNSFTAPATTLTAQSLISTTELAFESFLGNNFKFNDIDDCLFFMSNILKEKRKIDANFLINKSSSELISRLKTCFYNYKETYDIILENYIDNLSQEDINRIYYKNNIYEFSYLFEIRSLLSYIMDITEDFKNPNKIPNEIKEPLDELWSYYKEFVFYNNFYFDRIKRLKNDRRNTVNVIDTDSNIANLNPWYEFVKNTIVKYNNRLNTRDDDNMKFIIINIMCYLLTNMINDVLKKYGKYSNLLKQYRGRLTMKNEYLFFRLVIGDAKKCYLSSMKLREGKEFNPPKIDVKGFQFMKSVTREDTGAFFKKLCRDRILLTDKIDIAQILNDIEYLEEYIKESLLKGEKNFLIPKSVKELEAYKEPHGEQGVRAILAWNAAYPEREIVLPEKVDMIKVHMETLDKISDLYHEEPDIYNRIKDGIFNCPIDKIRSKGIEVFAVPRNEPKIPEWIMPYIDHQTIVNDNISKFNGVLKSFGIEIVEHSKGKFFTNIIKI